MDGAPAAVVVRVEDAGLGPGAPVRLVVAGASDPERLRSVWAASGAAVERVGQRLRATTTVADLERAVGRAFGREAATSVAATARAAIAAWSAPPPAVELSQGMLPTDARPLVMGIVNVTPDSFSDGGALYPRDHPDAAVAHGRRLVAEGADVLDVGGESTRPGAEPVAVDEELRRVVPVVAALADSGMMVSVDTTKPAVAAAALDVGAVLVNDVSGGADDDLLAVVADAGAGYLLMHTRGTPATMAELAHYDDVVAEVYEFLAHGLQRCAAAGIAADRVVVDPGLGFAKTAASNLVLLRDLRQLRGFGRPVAVGASRKRFLGALLGGADAGERLEGSLACAAAAVGAGAALLRVHDVAETVRTVRVAHAVATGSPT